MTYAYESNSFSWKLFFIIITFQNFATVKKKINVPSITNG